jgi:hypothetical protein
MLQAVVITYGSGIVVRRRAVTKLFDTVFNITASRKLRVRFQEFRKFDKTATNLMLPSQTEPQTRLTA